MNTIYEYTLSTAYDPSTKGSARWFSLDSNNGLRMFNAGWDPNESTIPIVI